LSFIAKFDGPLRNDLSSKRGRVLQRTETPTAESLSLDGLNDKHTNERDEVCPFLRTHEGSLRDR